MFTSNVLPTPRASVQCVRHCGTPAHSGYACRNIRVILFTAAVARCAFGEHFLASTLGRFVQELSTYRVSFLQLRQPFSFERVAILLRQFFMV